MTRQVKGTADHFVPGDWNTVCYTCGRKIKGSEARKQWQGYWVCPEDWEPRHPQDFVRGVADNMAAPWVQPPPAAIYTTANVTGHLITANYTITVADSDYTLTHPASDTTARTVILRSAGAVNAQGVEIGARVQVVNEVGAGTITIQTIGGIVLTWIPSLTAGNRTLAAGGIATLLKTGKTNWQIYGSNLT